MADPAQPINPTQLFVLQWVVDGCPDGVMTGSSFKTTAYALRDRRLVTLSKKGGGFALAPTGAGRHYLAHRAYPDGHWPAMNSVKRRNRPLAPQSVVTGSSVEPAQVARVPRPSSTAVKPTPPAKQLVLDVIAAGGSLVVDRDNGSVYEYNQLARAAVRFQYVPAGKALSVESDWRTGTTTIVLADQQTWVNSDLQTITVPATLRNPHPAVEALRDNDNVLAFAAATRLRALRILQALAKAASARGHTVEGSKPRDRLYEQDRQPAGQLLITIKGNRFGVLLREHTTRTPHQLTNEEIRRQKQYATSWAPRHDYVANGQLSVTISRSARYMQSEWRDHKAHQLETMLPQVLQGVEIAANEQEQDRLDQMRKQDDERRRWEADVAAAKLQMIEAHRAEVLYDQAVRWQRFRLIDEYVDAMRLAVDDMDDEGSRAAAEEWLTWARRHRALNDPLVNELAMPTPPAATADNMRPFLQGWSFSGPQRG